MLYNIIKRRALGRAQSHLGEAISPGEGQSHLGATRPRVGICLTRLDALASKYKTRPLSYHCIAKLGHRAPT